MGRWDMGWNNVGIIREENRNQNEEEEKSGYESVTNENERKYLS